jgi:hypothetical protein
MYDKSRCLAEVEPALIAVDLWRFVLRRAAGVRDQQSGEQSA